VLRGVHIGVPGANLDKTQADAWDINQGHQSERTGIYADTLPAGREGGVEVALAAVAGLKLQRLHRGEFPAHQAIDIFIF
jgi:ferric enterobactin receptor